MSDRIFGIIVVIASVFLAWATSLTQESFLPQPVGPKTMPYILAFIGGVCGLYCIFRPDDEPSWPARAGWLEIGSAVLVMYAYAHLLPVLGFLIATALCASYFVWRFMAPLRESLIAGIVISVGIYSVFHLILGLSLAEGPFGF